LVDGGEGHDGDGGEGHDGGGRGGEGGGGSTRETVLSSNLTFVQSFLFLWHGISITLTFF
jgi:hypothetical protein